MAGTSLLTLIDDIANLLDDVAAMTKVATKKTAGVLGDDLALNAQQVVGLHADRELPVVWEVAKGSLKNKAILVPAALAISALAPWLVLPLLMFGGAFLCYEGCEKLAHKFLHSKEHEDKHKSNRLKAAADESVDMVAFEKDKIKGAIRTDFILSAEIIVITLGIVANEPLLMRVAVLIGIAIIMTVGVYGLVAGIVKLDDSGLHLTLKEGTASWAKMQRKAGFFILAAAPYLMKFLSIAGTAAMFMVGGGILAHGIPGAEPIIHLITESLAHVPGVGHTFEIIAPIILEALVGFIFGAIILAATTITGKAFQAAKQTAAK